jgi:multidrug efflux pump subunit AcrB
MRGIISFFIRYAVPVNVMLIVVSLFGIIGLLNLRSSFFPLVEANVVNIELVNLGASPKEMEESIVQRIEENLKGLVGVERVTSTSRENAANVTIEFEYGYDVNIGLQEVKNAVDRVTSFPTAMERPVVYKVENSMETMNFTISGDNVPLKTLKNIAYEIEADIYAMDGISQVSVSGFPDEEIEIAVRENDLRNFNLTFSQVAQAVSNANIIITGGSVKTPTEEYLIRANNRRYFGEELDNIVVKAETDGSRVYLKDVASVRDRWAESPNYSTVNSDLAVFIRVTNTPNENLLKSSEQLNEYILEFNESHDNIKLTILRDAAITLQQRTALLVENGGIGILLVLLFLSLFLLPRLAIWVAIGLPFSFFGFFMLADYFNVTINVLSLFGLIMVIGILVDDGIVISENIYQHYEKGKTRVQAALDGTMEVVPPIVAAIVTTMVAFCTFYFIDGRLGQFFGEISTVVIITLAVSLIEALIILPSHIAHSGALKKGAKKLKINIWADNVLTWFRDNTYGPFLRFILNHRFFGLAIIIGMFIITIGAIQGGIIRMTFFPQLASDFASINLTMPQGTNERVTDSLITEIEYAVWETNEILSEQQSGDKEVVQKILKSINATNTASLTVYFLPGEERDFRSSEIIQKIREVCPEIPGAEALSFDSRAGFGGKPISIALAGRNIEELKGAKTMLKNELRENEQLRDVNDDDPQGIKEVRIKLKPNAYLLGLTLNDVMRQVRSGFFGYQAQRIQRGRDEVRIWVRYERSERESLANLDDMWISTPRGGRVPLSEIAEYDIERGEISIKHLDGRRVITVDAELASFEFSAADILSVVQEDVMPIIQARYPTVKPLYEGQNREASRVGGSAAIIVPVILMLIMAIIGFTFRSYSQPFMFIPIILLSLTGVFWGHWVHGQAVNILSLLGIIALIGILVNDGLVLIGKFNGYIKEGMDFDTALYTAGTSRFRAIFLTTITTVAGLAPLIFERSFQAQFLKPMAISIAYGIAFATILTLVLLPILLSLTNSFKTVLKSLWEGRDVDKVEVERAYKETLHNY